MRRDPFVAVPTTVRLCLAALLACAAPTADYVYQGAGYYLPGVTIYGDCGYSTGPYCTTDVTLPSNYVPGASYTTSYVQIRFLLWAAALVLFVVAALRRTAQTRVAARGAVVALVAALALGLSERSPLTVALVSASLLLAAPPVWRPADRGAFGSRLFRR